jgi:hypothetical protein
MRTNRVPNLPVPGCEPAARDDRCSGLTLVELLAVVASSIMPPMLRFRRARR